MPAADTLLLGIPYHGPRKNRIIFRTKSIVKRKAQSGHSCGLESIRLLIFINFISHCDVFWEVDGKPRRWTVGGETTDRNSKSFASTFQVAQARSPALLLFQRGGLVSAAPHRGGW